MRHRLTYANVMATLAFFFALTGASLAGVKYIATSDPIPATSDLSGTFGNPQIGSGRVTTGKIADGAITSSKFSSSALAPNADKLDGIDSTGFLLNAAPTVGQQVGEPWHEVGTAGNPPFAPNFLPVCVQQSESCPWENYGNGYETAAFYKDPLGIVHLKGLISPNCTDATSSPCGGGDFVFTLPVGYRPDATAVFLDQIDASAFPFSVAGRLDISPDGSITTVIANRNSFVSLAGITFRAGG